mmetsp:Transcript_19153/g.42990  ORF Transcript_19153/g.42990 Transcript_19153/m.42990 type:complete len:212 (-) Transcript_19153:245-880(-)
MELPMQFMANMLNGASSIVLHSFCAIHLLCLMHQNEPEWAVFQTIPNSLLSNLEAHLVRAFYVLDLASLTEDSSLMRNTLHQALHEITNRIRAAVADLHVRGLQEHLEHPVHRLLPRSSHECPPACIVTLSLLNTQQLQHDLFTARAANQTMLQEPTTRRQFTKLVHGPGCLQPAECTFGLCLNCLCEMVLHAAESSTSLGRLGKFEVNLP